MKSMTGYGSGSFKNECYSVEIEIKSYNNRYLEINHNIVLAYFMTGITA